ncbi:MAG: hypothetical protein PSX81_11800, partial [bacterium]|nr:hypothetical protein [bacterium]
NVFIACKQQNCCYCKHLFVLQQLLVIYWRMWVFLRYKCFYCMQATKLLLLQTFVYVATIVGGDKQENDGIPTVLMFLLHASNKIVAIANICYVATIVGDTPENEGIPQKKFHH